MKKIVISFLVVLMAFSIVACGEDFKQGFEQGLRDGMEGDVEERDQDQEEQDVESVEPEETEIQVPEAEDQEEMDLPETEAPDEQEITEEDSPAEVTDNPLMNADIIVADVMNGTNTEKLGERAEIRVSKEVLKEVTQEQFAEFCNEVVKDSGYNWFTISCEDGTGIQFAGSVSYVSTYGTLDNDGCIEDPIGTIMVQEGGTYSYSETE